jgi:ABC-type cobalamin/Fe3+-siderophores transport system ATPase subunit
VSALEIRGLHFGYLPGRPVLRGVDLELPQGRVCTILGPNGSGKTTLLRCLLGQHAPTEGSIRLGGQPIEAMGPRERARQLAYVPQLPSSAFAFTVRELVAMGRYAHQGALGLASHEDRDQVQRALERTGTDAFADRTMGELSGGEAQCVMIARALAQQPRVMLLDEPTSHLDLRNQLLIVRLVRQLTREQGMAALVVGHDINLAARHSDTLALFHEGRVAATGRPTEVLQAPLLRATYGVEVELIPTDDGPPIVQAREALSRVVTNQT